MKRIPVNTVEVKEPWKGSYILIINGKVFQVSHFWIYNPVNGKFDYSVELAQEYNPSSKMTFFAPTMKGLVGKIKRLNWKVSTI